MVNVTFDISGRKTSDQITSRQAMENFKWVANNGGQIESVDGSKHNIKPNTFDYIIGPGMRAFVSQNYIGQIVTVKKG